MLYRAVLCLRDSFSLHIAYEECTVYCVNGRDKNNAKGNIRGRPALSWKRRLSKNECNVGKRFSSNNKFTGIITGTLRPLKEQPSHKKEARKYSSEKAVIAEWTLKGWQGPARTEWESTVYCMFDHVKLRLLCLLLTWLTQEAKPWFRWGEICWRAAMCFVQNSSLYRRRRPVNDHNQCVRM